MTTDELLLLITQGSREEGKEKKHEFKEKRSVSTTSTL